MLDTVVNQYGEALLDYLQESKFAILNGWPLTQNHDFTYISTRGKSVVDYILVPHDIYEQSQSLVIYLSYIMNDSMRSQVS